jgi:Tfp pilus assembly protein PilW
MRPVKNRVAHRCRDEHGFTLTELLIATILAMVVLGAGVTLFTASIRNQPRATTQAGAIQEVRTVMERIIRELRQGSSVVSASPSHVAMITYAPSAACAAGSPCRVTYACSSATCTRTEANPDGGAATAPVQVISGMSGGDVFTYTPATEARPASVGVSLGLPARDGSNAITLNDAATLRNQASP